jgi:hypothetical protein
MARLGAVCLAAVLIPLLAIQPARGYSVLSHEETVDLAWKPHIEPLLRERYPDATPEQIRVAHSYAYGGAIIQDLGYYPFGDHQLSDLLHYVRTGAFIDNLLAESHNLNEYAFALGALAHYRGDTTGHPAVGLATAREYPRLHAQFGPFVSYYDSPKAHIRTEYGFDVVQVAQGHYLQVDYANFIGFNVSLPVLKRAFQDTYGIPLDSVLKHQDLAVSTFRYSVSTAIPEMTRVAVVHYQKQIKERVPKFDRRTFVYKVKRTAYEQEYGKQHRKPGPGVYVINFLIRIMPKIGPLSVFRLHLPSAQDQTLYLNSMQTTAHRFDGDLDRLRAERGPVQKLGLPDLDYDTGKPTHLGEYPLADRSYRRLLVAVTQPKAAAVTEPVRESLIAYYAPLQVPHHHRLTRLLHVRGDRRLRDVERRVALLKGETPAVLSASNVAAKASPPGQ